MFSNLTYQLPIKVRRLFWECRATFVDSVFQESVLSLVVIKTKVTLHSLLRFESEKGVITKRGVSNLHQFFINYATFYSQIVYFTPFCGKIRPKVADQDHEPPQNIDSLTPIPKESRRRYSRLAFGKVYGVFH